MSFRDFTLPKVQHDSILDVFGQCAAAMVAVQRFNQQANTPSELVYGCVTTGSFWHFPRLSDKRLDIDLDDYQIAQADRILGVLLHCCR